MFYRLVRSVNEYYGLAVFGFFIAAFFVALAFTVIYPIVPFALLFASIFLAVFFSIVSKVLRAIERSLARRRLRHGVCPSCESSLTSVTVLNEALRECESCRLVLRLSGEEWQPDPDGPQEPVPAHSTSGVPVGAGRIVEAALTAAESHGAADGRPRK